MCRIRHRLEGSSPRAASPIKRKDRVDGRALQIRLAETLRETCKTDSKLALSVLRLLLTSPSLQRNIIPSALLVSQLCLLFYNVSTLLYRSLHRESSQAYISLFGLELHMLNPCMGLDLITNAFQQLCSSVLDHKFG